nr:integrase, catalytic region, zinc finger, CCHC-type, peptidase aspartic, catalytic [Tanacetum cinerariifolium]
MYARRSERPQKSRRRITAANKVPLREPIPLEVTAQESVVTKVYTRIPKVVQIILWYFDSGCSKHMNRDRSQLTNFVHKFLGTVKFGNDQIAKIMGYGDYQIGNITISRVYYVEGLGHNLFSVAQFRDSDLEVAFRKHLGFVRNLEGVDLLLGSRETNLYTLLIEDMMAPSPICLLSKASKTKSWLRHRRLSHLNFSAINHLAKHGLVRGLPKLKFEKDHMCSARAMGKSKKQLHKPKSKDTSQKKLYLLHMDLCAYANIRTYNRTEFGNQSLRDYYEQVGISHETSVARTPQQNSVVERRNRTLVEVARTMLIYAQAPLFLWSEAVATACYTQNRSIIRRHHGKTPYELLHDRKPDLFYLYVVVPVAAALRVVDLADSPVSTSIDEDAPSTSIPSTQDQEHYLIISQGFEESPKTPHFHDDPLHESLHEDTTSQGSSSNVRPIYTPFESLEPKNFKQAMTEPTRIDAMQEEIHEFERLQVWELVSCLEKVMLIKLKWIYKVMTDEFGGDNSSHVYKLKKALYSLKQAPRAWYDMLSSFLISQHLSKGEMDLTLFTQKAGNDLLLMSMMGKMSFFLELQISQSPRAYADADHVGCQDTRRSASGSAKFLGDKLVSWSSKKQKSTAISSIEAKYIALSRCCAQILLMRSQLTDYGFQFNKIPIIMSSITAQQAKLDLELVPKEKRFIMDKKKKFYLNLESFKDIFQICPRVHQDFDELPIDEVIVSFFKELGHIGEIKSITDSTNLWGMYYKKNVDYVELLWEDFTYINNRGHKNQDKMYYPRFTKVIIHYFLTKDKTISRRNKIGMHTSRDEHLINTLRFISVNKESQIYGARLLESMTSPEMRETKSYKTYLGYAIGVTPPKKARKFKKPASPKHTNVPASPKEPSKNEGTGVKPRVLDVSKSDSSESDNESWGDIDDDNESDDNDDEGSENDDDSCNNAQDSERTDSDEEENLNLNLNVDEEEETQEEEYVHTTDYSVPTDEETNDENKEFDDEEYDDLYKDVNVRSKVAEHKEVRKGYVKMPDATRESSSQKKSYKQVVEDAHVTLTTSQKTKGSKQSSFVSSDFASKFLILDNVPPVIDEVASMMNFKVPQGESSTQAPPLLSVPVTVIPKNFYYSCNNRSSNNSTIHFHSTTINTTPEPTIEPSTTLIPALPDFSSLFGFDHRVSNLENELSQLKQEVSDFATPVIQSAINESLENVILAKSSSQPKSTYKVITSLIEFKLKKILLDKIQKSKLYQAAPKYKELYDAFVKSYKLDKDIFDSYDNIYSLKRDRDDKNKDEDPSAGSNRGLKKRKTSKDVEPKKGLNTKESKSSSSKGTKSQSKSSGKSVQAKEPEFEVADSDMPQNQEGNLGNDDEDPMRVVASKRY